MVGVVRTKIIFIDVDRIAQSWQTSVIVTSIRLTSTYMIRRRSVFIYADCRRRARLLQRRRNVTARCILTTPLFAEPAVADWYQNWYQLALSTILDIAREKSLAHDIASIHLSFRNAYSSSTRGYILLSPLGWFDFFFRNMYSSMYVWISYWGGLMSKTMDCNRPIVRWINLF